MFKLDSKKKKYILIVLSTILFILCIYGVTKLVENNFPRLDKYQYITDYCEVEKKGLDLNMNCNAFLVRMVLTEKSWGCFDYIIVKDYSSIKELKICEDKNLVDHSNEALYTEMKTPIYLVFRYTKDSLFSYKFENITMTPMERVQVIEILEQLKKNDIEITDVLIRDI